MSISQRHIEYVSIMNGERERGGDGRGGEARLRAKRSFH